MSSAKMNPATLNCTFALTSAWLLTYVDSTQQAPKKGKAQRRKIHRAGHVQSVSYTSKGVVDGKPGQALVFITTDRQNKGDLPFAFQASLLDLAKIPSDLRVKIVRSSRGPKPVDIASEFLNL